MQMESDSTAEGLSESTTVSETGHGAVALYDLFV